MNPYLAIAAYLLAGLTTAYIEDQNDQLSEDPGGYAFITMIVILWPLFALGLILAGLYHVFAATIDAFRDRT